MAKAKGLCIFYFARPRLSRLTAWATPRASRAKQAQTSRGALPTRLNEPTPSILTARGTATT